MHTMSDQVFVNFSPLNNFLHVESTSHAHIFFGSIKFSWLYEYIFFTFLSEVETMLEHSQSTGVQNS